MNRTPPHPVFQLTHVMDRGGGAEEVVANIVRRLDRRLYRPIVGCLWWGGTYAEELREEGIEVFTVGQKEIGKWKSLRKLVAFLRRERVVIVHTHMFMSNTWGRMAALLAGVPIIVATEHLVREFVNPVKHFIPDLLLSWGTDRITTVSERVRQTYVRGSGIRGAKIETIYNGIDLEKFNIRAGVEALRNELCLDGNRPVIGVVARFVEQKGHIYLLEAAREVVKKFPNARFLLLGDGPLKNKLIQLAEGFGILDNIIFAGIRHDMPEIYPLMDISVLASLAEGFSITVLESMASGVPVVVTDVGGNGEIVIEGVNGYLVPPKAPAELAEKMILLLKDPEKRRRMGRAARQRVVDGGFTVVKFVENIEALYGRLLRQKRIT
ncbi:MAG: glycosyltransferase [Candidatus Glassbacteria bacterium]